MPRLGAGAQAALGDRFDLPAFHDPVLGGGALPLTTPAELVQRDFVGVGVE